MGRRREGEGGLGVAAFVVIEVKLEDEGDVSHIGLYDRPIAGHCSL